MINSITAIVVAVGSTAALILWILKNLYGTSAAKKQIKRKQREVDEITQEMSKMLRGQKAYNYEYYRQLHDKRVQLNREIARAKRTLGNKRSLFGRQ